MSTGRYRIVMLDEDGDVAWVWGRNGAWCLPGRYDLVTDQIAATALRDLIVGARSERPLVDAIRIEEL